MRGSICASFTQMLKKSAEVVALGFACGIFFVTFSEKISAQDLSSDTIVDGERVVIRLQSLDANCQNIEQITIGRLFCLRMVMESTNNAWLKDLKVDRFDAIMPEHRHGMVTRPKLSAVKNGEYLIRGVKLHMSGDWKFTINLMRGNSSAQVAIPMKL